MNSRYISQYILYFCQCQPVLEACIENFFVYYVSLKCNHHQMVIICFTQKNIVLQFWSEQICRILFVGTGRKTQCLGPLFMCQQLENKRYTTQWRSQGHICRGAHISSRGHQYFDQKCANSLFQISVSVPVPTLLIHIRKNFKIIHICHFLSIPIILVVGKQLLLKFTLFL